MNTDNANVRNTNVDNTNVDNANIGEVSKKILIVDDEPDNLELIRFVLEDIGFDTTVAHNGLEALAKINTEKFDLVLLDIMMPDITGWDILKKIKDKNAATPVIILTAKARNIDKLLGMRVLKADDYITKPFLKKELIDKVKRLTDEVNRSTDP